jgi:transposase
MSQSNEQGLFGDVSSTTPPPPQVAGTPRLRKPVRDQGIFSTDSLDQRLDADHVARMIWAYVEQMDLSPLLRQIKSVKGHQGRDAIDPRVLMALWLYAVQDGVGSARQLERLCSDHHVYQWICGAVSVNYHTLSDFRAHHGQVLDQLLIDSLASLSHEGLIDVNTVAQDGMRIRASAAGDSFRRECKLEEHLADAKKHVATLNEEIALNPRKLSARRKQAQLRAATEKQTRLEQALENVRIIAKGREARKKGDGQNARASSTDPEARRMKMSDGGTRPAYNAQVVTDIDSGIVVAIEASNACNDSSQLVPMMKEAEHNLGRKLKAALADGGYNTKANVNWAAQKEITLYTPVKELKKQLKEGKDPYAPHKGDSPAMIDHRVRMKQEASQELYGLRGETAEWTNARLRRCGLYMINVRGKEKVRAMLVIVVLALNLIRAEKLRQERKEASIAELEKARVCQA